MIKRGLWSTIAQIYDPIGLCAPFFLSRRRLLQELLKEVPEWDDPIPKEYQRRRNIWVRSQQNLEKLENPRRYWNVYVDTYELLTFCDSSEHGMGCVSYLRMTKGQQISVAFIMGKSKVVPNNSTISIPQLEQLAAVLGAKMHRHIKNAIHLPLRNCYLYSGFYSCVGLVL